MNLQDAKVVITGATGGIGLETARLLKSKGADVVICGTDNARVERAVKETGAHGIKANVASEAEVKALFDFALDKMGSINVLINNAGIGQFSALTDTSLDDFSKVWEVNVKGYFMAGKLAAGLFKEQQYGNIINIGSTAALKGFANGSAYVASKFAVTGLTDCWRAELRPYNIRVMQVNPSEVITDFMTKSGFEIKNEEKKLKPEDIAHTIASMLTMRDTGFILDASVWATNPW
jgi:3-oxoacyl-[acyl-carrier protein] reductase